MPVDPVPVDPVPADPVGSAPVESGPAAPAATGSAATESAAREPVRTESVPVESVSAGSDAPHASVDSDSPRASGDGGDAPGATPSAADPTGRRALLPLVLVGLLTVAMIAGVALLGLRLRTQSQTAQARDEAVVASRDAARVLFSYDHATLDADFERGLSVTTGEFKQEYSRTTKEVVTDVAKQYKAVVVADVVESAVVGASPREVTTVVFLNQATTSTQVEGRKIDQSRVRMRLEKVGDRWLVAAVDAL